MPFEYVSCVVLCCICFHNRFSLAITGWIHKTDCTPTSFLVDKIISKQSLIIIIISWQYSIDIDRHLNIYFKFAVLLNVYKCIFFLSLSLFFCIIFNASNCNLNIEIHGTSSATKTKLNYCSCVLIFCFHDETSSTILCTYIQICMYRYMYLNNERRFFICCTI